MNMFMFDELDKPSARHISEMSLSTAWASVALESARSHVLGHLVVIHSSQAGNLFNELGYGGLELINLGIECLHIIVSSATTQQNTAWAL